MSRSDARPLSLGATLAALAGALCLGCAILPSVGAASALAAPSCAPPGSNTVCTFSTPLADTFTVPAGSRRPASTCSGRRAVGCQASSSAVSVVAPPPTSRSPRVPP
jgi:hypothetical protein